VELVGVEGVREKLITEFVNDKVGMEARRVGYNS
jgi:hypothetical protein